MNAQTLKRVAPDAIIMLLVVLVYLPALQAGFIWDDDAHLTANANIVGSGGLQGIWTSSAATYYPLVLTSFWLQHALWGLHPLPYHLVNVLVHATCAILLRHVLIALSANSFAATLGAVMWALHPVQTESVAWITELKNTQSGVFYLLAVLLFLKWRSNKTTALYFLFLLSAVCALLSKTSTVMLPVVLLLCVWWLDGQWNWHALRGIGPFFLLSAAAGGWTIWEQRFHSGALGTDWTQTLPERIAVAGYSIWFYLGKLIWPNPLVFLYPRWNVDTHTVLAFIPILTAGAAMLALWGLRNTTLRPMLFAFAYFVISLFPVLDFFDVYFFRYSFVGDHFQYLAAMGPLALAGCAVVRALKVKGKTSWAPFVCAGFIAVLGGLTLQHEGIFHDNERLWRDTTARNPDAWLAHNNLATIFMDRDNPAAAIVELEATLRLQPHYAEGHANLANILFESGRYDEAASHFELALEGESDYGRIHDYLGVSLMMSGRIADGITHIRKAIEIDPHDATAHVNLGIALGRQGKMDEAMAQFKEAVQLDPTGLNPRMRYGTALLAQQEFAGAEAQFTEAIKLSPKLAAAHKFLGIALAGLQRNAEARLQFTAAIELDPDDSEARQKLEQLGP